MVMCVCVCMCVLCYACQVFQNDKLRLYCVTTHIVSNKCVLCFIQEAMLFSMPVDVDHHTVHTVL